MMKHTTTIRQTSVFISLILLASAQAASPIRVIRTADTREPADQALTVLYGETIDLRVRMLNYAAPVDLTGWAITLHGQTNGQSEAESYQLAGLAGLPEDPAAAALGWASVELPVSTWWPRNASAGRWSIVATSPEAALNILRAGGPLAVRGSAAADVTAAPPMIVAAALRTQWLADIAAATNGLAQGGWASAGVSPEDLAVALATWAPTGTVARATWVTGPQSNLLNTSLQPSWGPTGRVSYADIASRLSVPGDAIYWQTICDGTATIWRVTADTNRLYIASASEDYNGPAVGSIFLSVGGAGPFVPDSLTYEAFGIGYANIDNDGHVFITDNLGVELWDGNLPLPSVLVGDGSCVIDYVPVTNSFHLSTTAEMAAATNALVQTYFLGTNAWMTISNSTLSIWRSTNGIPATLWSSAESSGDSDSIDPAFTNAIWDAIGAFDGQLAGKANKSWGQYAPDGSDNPDPDYMTFFNSPATMHASGYQWASYGSFSVLAQSGAVAFETGSNGEARWGLDLQTNYIAFVRGGSVIVGARPGSISIAEEVAEIVYSYTAGDFPVLWFSPALSVPFAIQEGVAWVDNTNGTATVSAPATTPKGFWYATTSASFDTIFEVHPPARMIGGVFGTTNALPVIYDSTIEVTSGGKTYRIPAQKVP